MQNISRLLKNTKKVKQAEKAYSKELNGKDDELEKEN